LKAVARVFWTFCTALPIQRWLGVLALALSPLAALSLGFQIRGLWVASFLAFVLYAFATAMAAGYLLRVWSAPRAHRFLPRFRGRSLSAFFGVVVLVALPWLALVVRAPNAVALVFPLFLPIGFTVFAFFPVGGFVAMVAAVVLGWLVSLVGLARPGALGAVDGGLLAAPDRVLELWAALWLAFALWYLRERRIAPFEPALLMSGRLSVALADTSGRFDRGRAVAASLRGSYPQRGKQALALLAAWMLFVALICEIGRHATPEAYSGAFPPAWVLPGVLLGAVANQRARRTKLLWLRRAVSRRGLFALTERQLWRSAVAKAAVGSAVLTAGAALTFGVPAEIALRGLASAAATCVLGVYLGLALVRGRTWLEICAQIPLLTSGGVGAWAALAAPARDRVLVFTILLQLTAALALRAVAIGQWRTIDWLVFKPLRVASQSLRARQ
jgi:hypothetical protein